MPSGSHFYNEALNTNLFTQPPIPLPPNHTQQTPLQPHFKPQGTLAPGPTWTLLHGSHQNAPGLHKAGLKCWHLQAMSMLFIMASLARGQGKSSVHNRPLC